MIDRFFVIDNDWITLLYRKEGLLPYFWTENQTQTSQFRKIKQDSNNFPSQLSGLNRQSKKKCRKQSCMDIPTPNIHLIKGKTVK